MPDVLRSIYQSKFFKKYCRRNFRTIDLTWNSYFGLIVIIFGEKNRKNEKNRFLNFKSTYYIVYLFVDLKKHLKLFMRQKTVFDIIGRYLDNV